VKLLGQLGPHARRNWLATLRGLLDFAVVEGFIRENPAASIKIKAPKTEGHRPWTEPEVTQYEARHPIGTKARLAVALGLYTALRKGDCLSLGPQNIRGGLIYVTQEKTGGKLQLPIRPELQEILDATPCRHLKFLVKDSGEAYTGVSFWHQSASGARKPGYRRPASFTACAAHVRRD
jgi:integrase